MQKPITVLTGLDYWLDNLMCNVPELAMCFHLNGIVQVRCHGNPSRQRPRLSVPSLIVFAEVRDYQDGGHSHFARELSVLSAGTVVSPFTCFSSLSLCPPPSTYFSCLSASITMCSSSLLGIQEVLEVAQNILAFLKANCTMEGHTYWLFRRRGEDIVKLYDLTSLNCFEVSRNIYARPDKFFQQYFMNIS